MSDSMNNMTIHALLKSLTVSTPADAEPKVQKRCGNCKKKLCLSDFTCDKCKTRFCGAHRLPELHACPHDYKKEGKALLEKLNPRVVNDKLERC